MSTHNVLMNEWSLRFRGECWEHLGHRSVLTWRWSQSIRMINRRHIARYVKKSPLSQHLIAPAEALPCVVAQGRGSLIYSKSNTNRTISADWRSTALGKQSIRKIYNLIYSEWLFIYRGGSASSVSGVCLCISCGFALCGRKADLFVTREQSSLERASRVYL